jgi:ubiquinone/menaquinone biosynthesis C-methylase UbiE
MKGVPQSSYEALPKGVDTLGTETLISEAFYQYLVGDLGLPDQVARERTTRETAGDIPKDVCNELLEAGFPLSGVTVLDLGAGMGGMSAELAQRGCRVISVEPGAGWRSVSARRLSKYPNASVIGAVGEHLPLANNSVDVVVSLQVLEHVADPQAVIQEVFRVLKPGGHFYAAYENYLSFYEPHYRVAWLPLLPKSIGAIYLQLRGRSPKFLKESITYTTFPAVQSYLKEAGFRSLRREQLERGLRMVEKAGPRWKILKAIAQISPKAAVHIAESIDALRTCFRTANYIFVTKPFVIERNTSNSGQELFALSEALRRYQPAAEVETQPTSDVAEGANVRY